MSRAILLACVLGATLAAPSGAAAALVAHEPYDYPVGSDLSAASGGTGWNSFWSSNLATTAQNSTGDTAGSGSLSYVDSLGNTLAISGNRGMYQATLNTTGADGVTSQAFRRLPAIRGAEGVADNTTTWVAFMGQRLGQKSGATPHYERGTNVSLFNSTLATSQEQLAIGEGSGRTEDVWGLIPEGSAANTRLSTTPFDKLSLVVVRIDHLQGNDNAYLFIDPVLGVEPLIANAAANSLGTYDFSFDTVRPFAGNSQQMGAVLNGEIQIDELRVGDTYADVTPFIPVPEPASAGVAVLALLAVAGRRLGRGRAG